MGFIDVFGAKLAAMAAVYFLVSLAPVWWPAWRAFRSEPRVPRPFLFVGTVAALAYGVSTFFALALFLPMAAVRIFLVPELERSGVAYGTALGHITNAATEYGWIVLVVIELLTTWYITRWLARRWTHLCSLPVAGHRE